MPSASLLHWQNHQMIRLAEIEAQCTAVIAATPSNPELIEDNLRALALLLSANFQGFCRDLYIECAQIVTSKVRASLQTIVQNQFTAKLRLDQGNPNFTNIKEDFSRFGFTLDLVVADPANATRLNQLSDLNKWRNVAAHSGHPPSGVSLTLVSLQEWRNACDGLAVSLDNVMYNELKALLRRAPW